GSYALSWKPCQGDSLNLPDHMYSIYTVKRFIADVASSFQQSQIHIIKLSIHYNQDYSPQEVIEQSRMSRYYPSKDKEIITGRRSKVRDLDSGEKFKTSTLGEIVSLEKSNKNVLGFQPTSQSQFSISNRLNGVIELDSSVEMNDKPSQRDLDNLFGPLYEEYYVPRTLEVLYNSATNTLDNKDTSSSSSIIVEDNDALQIVSLSEESIA
nr:hypothetical protein [Tanacetum cinerariifolium]